MGTTVSALVHGRRLRVVIAHIGDSRIYLLPRRRADPDHDRPHVRAAPRRLGPHHAGGGAVPPAPLGAHARARRHGLRPRGRHLHHADTSPGDRWLLCSDGLSGVVDDDAHRQGARPRAWRPAARPTACSSRRSTAARPTTSRSCSSTSGGQHPIFSGTPDDRRLGVEPARRSRCRPRAPAARGWLHPNRQAANEPSHFEPAAEITSRSSSRRTGAARAAGASAGSSGSSLVLGAHRRRALRRLQVDPDPLLRRRPTTTPS